MPICIPSDLPAYQTLRNERIFVMDSHRAASQDIRPLRVLILNLMPKKIETECQFLRLLSNSSLQVVVDFLQVSSHNSKNTAKSHLDTFYLTFDEVRHRHYDGCIITGAPVEQLPFEEVDYWKEVCSIMDWTCDNVFSTLHICWGALAGLYHHFGVPKVDLPQKMFGVFPQTVEKPEYHLLHGFDDVFNAPHSRHAAVQRADIEKVDELEILTSSPISGVHIVANKNGRQYFITGHSEYDRCTLQGEYQRDIMKGLKIDVPYNYFPEDNPLLEPHYSWGCSANLLFSNWLNYCVYQLTPYNLNQLSQYNQNQYSML